MTYSRIEHATSDTVKDPDIDSNGSAERACNVKQTSRGQRSAGDIGLIVVDGRLSSGKREHKEHEGATKLSKHHHQDVTNRIPQHVLALPRLPGTVASNIENLAYFVGERHGWQTNGGCGRMKIGVFPLILVSASLIVLAGEMERFSRRLGSPVVMTDELQTKLVKTSKGGTSVAPNMASKYDPSGYLCFLQRLPNVIGKVKVKRVGIAPLSRCTKEKEESYGFRMGYENLRTSKMLLRVQQDMCFSFLLSPCVRLYLTLPRLELLHLTWVNPKLSSRQGRLRRVVGLVRWMKKRLFFGVKPMMGSFLESGVRQTDMPSHASGS